jgi:hypothetical protein
MIFATPWTVACCPVEFKPTPNTVSFSSLQSFFLCCFPGGFSKEISRGGVAKKTRTVFVCHVF